MKDVFYYFNDLVSPYIDFTLLFTPITIDEWVDNYGDINFGIYFFCFLIFRKRDIK